MKKLKIFFQKHWFLLSIVFFSVIKQIMISNIPIFAISNGSHDDLMMVNMGNCLLNGWWLGEYSQYTLVKGIFFPAFLALTNFLGISYLNAANLFYTFSCIFFIYAIKDVFKGAKQKILMITFFIILLFNPVSFASWTFQRLYRNGMTLSQVLLIFGGFFAAYQRINQNINKSIPWLLAAGFGLSTLANTREDAIWIYPFIIVVSLVLIIKRQSNSLKEKTRVKLKNAIILLIPIIMLILTNNIISTINYVEYGIYTTNELNNSSFKSAMKSIYSVKNKEEIEYVSVTREKLNRIYKMSPTLNTIKDEMEDRMDDWSKIDRNPKDNEVEDGWFFWAFRDAVDRAGYYKDAKTANKFYKKVSNEINNYIEKHNVKTIKTMPSALMSPWRKGYGKKLIKTSAKILNYIVSFNEVETTNSISVDDGSNGINKFEAISNEKAYSPKWNFKLKGWFFSKDGHNLELQLQDSNGKILQELHLQDSKDVYEHYHKNYDKSRNCRFETSIELNGENPKLVIVDKDTNKQYDMNLESDEYSIDNKDYKFSIDNNTKINYDYVNQMHTQKYVNRLNKITDIYKSFNVFVFVLSAILYTILTTRIVKEIKNKKLNKFPVWLMITSVILSLVVLILGVSYNEIASCASIRYMYLSGSYPLLLIFELLTILYFVKEFIIGMNKKSKEKLKLLITKVDKFLNDNIKAKEYKLTKSQVLFLIFMFVAMFLWSVFSPYNYGPDEAMRYLIPKYIYNHGKLPLPDNKEVISTIFNASYAYYPLLLGSVLSAIFMKLISFISNDSFSLVVAARFTSVIFGTLFVYFMMKISNRLFSNNKLKRWFMIIFSSMIPQLTFLSSYVNNDIIALCGSSVIVYAWILMIQDKCDTKNCIILALGISLVMLSYYNAYAWILMSIILFVSIFISKNNQKKLKFNYKEFLKKGSTIAFVVIALTGFFFIRNIIVNNGDMLGMHSFLEACERSNSPNPNIKPSTRDTPKNLHMTVWESLWTKHYLQNSNYVQRTYESFIGTFGYMAYRVDDFVLNLFKFIIIIGIVGFVLKIKDIIAEKKYVVFHVCIILSILITIILGIYYMYATDYQPQGRYLFPILTGISIIISIGIEKILLILKNYLKNKYIYIIIKITTYSILIIFLVYSYISATSTFIQSIR